MLVVTQNAVYFVSQSVGEMKLGRDNPPKVKWGKVNPEGSIDTSEGKLLCLQVGKPMIIEDNLGNSKTTSPVEKVILR